MKELGEIPTQSTFLVSSEQQKGNRSVEQQKGVRSDSSTIVIEATDKRIKKQQLIGAVLSYSGLAGLICGGVMALKHRPSAEIIVLSLVITAVGILISTVARFSKWWHHG